MIKEPTPALVTLGENIRYLRDKLDISQEELAHLAGLERSYLGKVERGKRNLTILTALKISSALEVELSDIVKGVQGA